MNTRNSQIAALEGASEAYLEDITKTVSKIVAAALEGASESYLQDIAAHGIHNVTNAYNGGSDEAYEAFMAEFEAQARAALAALENARLAKFRTA